MEIKQLTQFQFTSLAEISATQTHTYMLVKPNKALDKPEDFERFVKNNVETDELVGLGLLDDVSPSYSDALTECAQTTGRIYRVFRLTNAGAAMFENQKKPLSIN